jgi:hypothetical protein
MIASTRTRVVDVLKEDRYQRELAQHRLSHWLILVHFDSPSNGIILGFTLLLRKSILDVPNTRITLRVTFPNSLSQYNSSLKMKKKFCDLWQWHV